MKMNLIRLARVLLAVSLVLSIQSCRMLRAAPGSDLKPVAATLESPTTRTEITPSQTKSINNSPTRTPFVNPLEAITPTSAPAKVTITAVDGNIFIRRGPHMAFNPIAVLYQGEIVSALSRDVLARWVRIPIPSQPGQMGWLYLQTRFTSVSGNVLDLPVIDTVDWPEGAYLRNCTHHEMLVQPGEIIIPSSYEFPDNIMAINPGVYRVYDLEVDGEPEVMKNVELREGITVDIREDASGERRKC